MQVTVQSQSLGAPKPDDKKRKSKGSKKAPLIPNKRPQKVAPAAKEPKRRSRRVEEPEEVTSPGLDEEAVPVTGFGDLRAPEPEDELFASETPSVTEGTDTPELAAEEAEGEDNTEGTSDTAEDEPTAPAPSAEEVQSLLAMAERLVASPSQDKYRQEESEEPSEETSAVEEQDDGEEQPSSQEDDDEDDDALEGVKTRGHRRSANIKKQEHTKPVKKGDKSVKSKKASKPVKEKATKPVREKPVKSKRAKRNPAEEFIPPTVTYNYNKGFVPFIVAVTGLCAMVGGACYFAASFIL